MTPKPTKQNGLLYLLPTLIAALLIIPAPTASAEALPDGRVYEMVTPPENHQADVYVPFAITEGIFPAGEGGTHTKLPFQVAKGGEAVAYIGDPTIHLLVTHRTVMELDTRIKWLQDVRRHLEKMWQRTEVACALAQ